MKIKIECGEELEYLLIARIDKDWGRYHAVIRGDRFASEFPMPKGDGFLEINI